MATFLDSSEREAVEHDRRAFNMAVWEKVLADPELAKLPYRIESDEYGQLIMSPPPSPEHGRKQSEISFQLRKLMQDGEVVTECPISTSKGVKAADVAWCSADLWTSARQQPCFPRAPEICVEIISASNSAGEIEEKKLLYFEAGAEEIWLCDSLGELTFHRSPSDTVAVSALCSNFPEGG